MAGWQGLPHKSLNFSHFQTTIKSHALATGSSKLAALLHHALSIPGNYFVLPYIFMIDMVT